MDILDFRDLLIVLANNFPCLKVELKFKKYYKNDKIRRVNKINGGLIVTKTT